MNTYSKFTANVFLMKTQNEYQKGDIATVTTKYGKENESIVYNLIYSKDGYNYYSIIRADGFNVQERAKLKAERYGDWAESAEKKSEQYHEASNEGRDFLIMAEPIKVGHHSEKRHRALIERNWSRMEKSVEFRDKAKEHERKAEYWANKANTINLSMPESLEFFEFKLEEAINYHKGLKDGSIARRHSYSLAYAKKEVNELTKKLNLAQALWA